MYSKTLLFFTLFLLGYKSKATNGPLIVPSSLTTATIYRTGAELIHNASAQLQQGNVELLIQGVSNNVDINSIQIKCPSAVTIMGVEFNTNFLVQPEADARVKFLTDSLVTVQKDLDKVNVQIQTTSELIEVLRSNRDIKGQQTGLSVAELMKLMDYYKAKSTELQNELAQEREKQKRLNEQANKLRAQITEEQRKNTKTSGELKLQLSVATAGKYDFVVSYVTPNAWWTPFYDIRVDDIKNPLKIIYKAKMVQTTGIDWKKVKLSLSTSVPNQWGNAPILNPWFLSYISPVNVMNKTLTNAPMALQGRVAGVDVQSNLNEVVVAGYGTKTRGAASSKDLEPLYVVNGAVMSHTDFAKLNPNSIKSMNVMKGDQATSIYGARASNGVIVVTLKDGLEDYVSVTDNELNVTFDVELPYDIPTNGKEQTATLKEYQLKALYKYYAVPKLDKDAYLLAELPDWEQLNLLPGEANIIFEGTYVGKSFVDPASTMDTLSLTLGRDKRVVIKKEKLVDFSSVKFLGSNKIQKSTYELTVKNNKKDTVRIVLKDQYPISTNKEIEIELLDNGGASVTPEIGLLDWNLQLAPGELKKLRFSYNVKYPKDKVVNLN
jgi:TonB-dependent SusC/RagA subfamily outer membrane receptor